ncbi:S-layer homology domain-containing protein [Paenibacillus sp. FSL W7-1287]|uniref:S-layer homology domain-containing protein n=1 Tax=Paenibacillus sp. FSL W7-1287 TaxID=2954538 RepID=UPI0030F727CA
MNWPIAIKKATKLAAAVIVSASLLASLSYTTFAATHRVHDQVNTRTEQDIYKKWQQYLPQAFNSDHLFEVEPKYSAPYSAGQLKQQVLKDAVNATNFARYLAGLPDDVTLDYSLAEQQQAGAVLMAELGTITHYPTKPSDMADDFFELGRTSASSSNLSAGRSSLYNTVFYGYMADNSGSNLYSVGHRRWILNPDMKKTMFGLAYDPSSRYRFYSTMYAFDRERDKNEVDYQYIAWPSAGLFPTDVLTAADPWSVSLNTSIYSTNKTDEIYVTIHRARDNKTWTLNASNQNEQGDFFQVNTGGYGINFAIIFRPKDIGAYTDGDAFEVTIHNLYTVSGEKTSLSYTTEMFSLQASFKNNATRYALSGQQLKLPIQGNATRFTSSDPSIASVDRSGIVTAHKPGYAFITVDNYLPAANSMVTVNVNDSTYSKISGWASSSIIQANEHGILNNSPYYQDLTTPVTREEFVHYVVGMLKALNPQLNIDDYYDVKSPFTDVRSTDSGIIWAYEQGIINGTGQGKFSPDNVITREQAATLLLNVYKYLGGELQPAAQAAFADQGKVASWAISSVNQAAKLSIMGGVSDTLFDPKGKYSHEQTIVTLLRLYQKFAK